VHDNCNIFLPLWLQLCSGGLSSKGEHGGPTTFKVQDYSKFSMCVRPAGLIDNYQFLRICVGMCNPGASEYHGML
jgi:hypothetical protein